jgi:fluoroquinolone resistance protein
LERGYTEGKTFEKINFSKNPLFPGEYETCHYIHCDFSDANLSKIKFSSCEFVDWNFSLEKLTKTSLGMASR